jgi:hypothetical protein
MFTWKYMEHIWWLNKILEKTEGVIKNGKSRKKLATLGAQNRGLFAFGCLWEVSSFIYVICVCFTYIGFQRILTIWVTWWVSYNMQELIVLLGCLCSIPVFGGIRVAHHLSFLGFIFCFVFLFVWVRPLFCAPIVSSFFLDFPFLITLSVFSKVLFNHHICSMYFAHGTRNDHYIFTLVYFSISNQCMISKNIEFLKVLFQHWILLRIICSINIETQSTYIIEDESKSIIFKQKLQ